MLPASAPATWTSATPRTAAGSSAVTAARDSPRSATAFRRRSPPASGTTAASRYSPQRVTSLPRQSGSGPSRKTQTTLFQTGPTPSSREMADRDAASRHPAGVNYLFGDGSVRFLKSTIDLGIYQALSSRAGGELIRADDY